MQETLKLIILTNHLYLVGKLTELEEEPSILIEDVYQVGADGSLQLYPMHTDQRYLFLTSDHVFSIVDPSTAVVKQYQSIGKSTTE